MADADTATVEGIDVDAVTGWFEAHVPEARPPLRFELIAGGRSNLTYSVTDDDGGRWVLRRPPLGHVLATAHDMGREHRIIAALADTDVPVPPAIGLSADDSVNGAPFYVMGFVDGPIVRNAAAAHDLAPAARAQASRSLVDVLARIHAVDLKAVGLDDLGRHEGYVERQLKRWQGQWEQTKTRELPVIDAVHDRLAASVPEQGPAAIVHGDYRLDNCIIGEEGDVRAVLDWELCTLGDPVVDACWSMQYWADPDDGDTFLTSSPTLAAALPRRDEAIGRYSAVGGRPLDDWPWYEAFGWWKMGCIVEGVHARRSKGQAAGAPSGPLEAIADRADRFLHLADEKARALGI
jgi:aminoglycoside phosphotransferase (APT) family kinase protein